MAYYCTYDSPIGTLLIESDGEYITRIDITKDKDVSNYNSNLDCFAQTKRWFDIYFTGKNPDFIPPIRLSGSDFRQLVGKIMLEIPFGKTTTYKAIKERVEEITGKPMSAQSVGGAVGHNPIAIIVPCHRVIGSDGNLTGYAYGLEAKTFLLKNEKTII